MGGCGQRGYEQRLCIGGGPSDRSCPFFGGERREWVYLQRRRCKAVVCPGGEAGKGQSALQERGKKGLRNDCGSLECRECGGAADGADSGYPESGRGNGGE